MTLGQLATAKGKLFGALLYNTSRGSTGTLRQISTDPVYAAAEPTECNWYVADPDVAITHIKQHSTFPYDFTIPDASMAYAKAHGMPWRAGGLVYDVGTFYLPSWWDSIATAAAAEAELINFITAIVTRYKGQVHSWQVINEVLQLPGVTSDGIANMRNGRVVAKLGASFYVRAFQAAHAADPDAILFINDNTLENNNPNTSVPRRAAMLKFIDKMLSLGAPVHALGMQAHLGPINANTNDATLGQFVTDVASRGLKVMVTELDVNDSTVVGDIPTRDAAVALAYQRFLNVMYPHPAVIGVSTWQLNDLESWLQTPSFNTRADKLPLRPLPLDTSYAKKAAYTAIVNAIALIPDADAPPPPPPIEASIESLTLSINGVAQ